MFKETILLNLFDIAEAGRKGLVPFIEKETNFPEDAQPIRWAITGHTIGQVEITAWDQEAHDIEGRSRFLVGGAQ